MKEKGQEGKSQGSSSQVLLFYGENSCLSAGEIQFAPKSVPLLIRDLASSNSPVCPRPPTDRLGLLDYSLRVDEFRTQPSTLGISLRNLEMQALAPSDLTTRLPLHKSLFRVLNLDLIDTDLHFCDNILITFAYIYGFSHPGKKDWRQPLMVSCDNSFDKSGFHPASQLYAQLQNRDEFSNLIVEQHAMYL